MNLTKEQVAGIRDHIGAGFIAARFAVEHWALFCAWAAEQVPEEPWTDDDKQNMEATSKVLYVLSDLND